MKQPTKRTTLCFLIKERECQVLLAMKKRGFGQGKWNGVGGKKLPHETIEEAVTRETIEEITVTPLSLSRVATLTFTYPDVPVERDWDHICEVFICVNWEGTPTESDEMAPQWHSIEQLPFENMWPDDPYWLPLVLASKKVEGYFTFSPEHALLSHQVSILS